MTTKPLSEDDMKCIHCLGTKVCSTCNPAIEVSRLKELFAFHIKSLETLAKVSNHDAAQVIRVCIYTLKSDFAPLMPKDDEVKKE